MLIRDKKIRWGRRKRREKVTRGENKEGEDKLGMKGGEMDGASGEEREEEGWGLIGRREGGEETIETSCEKFWKGRKCGVQRKKEKKN